MFESPLSRLVTPFVLQRVSLQSQPSNIRLQIFASWKPTAPHSGTQPRRVETRAPGFEKSRPEFLGFHLKFPVLGLHCWFHVWIPFFCLFFGFHVWIFWCFRGRRRSPSSWATQWSKPPLSSLRSTPTCTPWWTPPGISPLGRRKKRKNEYGRYGSKLSHQRTAGFSACVHLPGFFFGDRCLTHCQSDVQRGSPNTPPRTTGGGGGQKGSYLEQTRKRGRGLE